MSRAPPGRTISSRRVVVCRPLESSSRTGAVARRSRPIELVDQGGFADSRRAEQDMGPAGRRRSPQGLQPGLGQRGNGQGFGARAEPPGPRPDAARASGRRSALFRRTTGSAPLSRAMTIWRSRRRTLKSKSRPWTRKIVSMLAARTCSSVLRPAAFRDRRVRRGRTAWMTALASAGIVGDGHPVADLGKVGRRFGLEEKTARDFGGPLAAGRGQDDSSRGVRPPPGRSRSPARDRAGRFARTGRPSPRRGEPSAAGTRAGSDMTGSESAQAGAVAARQAALGKALEDDVLDVPLFAEGALLRAGRRPR